MKSVQPLGGLSVEDASGAMASTFERFFLGYIPAGCQQWPSGSVIGQIPGY
jgi:hypothetical protein